MRQGRVREGGEKETQSERVTIRELEREIISRKPSKYLTKYKP